MSLNLYIIFLTFGISLVLSRNVKFYRKDYTYIGEYDAYYKLHVDNDGFSWSTAFFACEKEGSQLFYPKSTGDNKIVKQLFIAQGLSSVDYKDILVGIQNERTEEFITVDGNPNNSSLKKQIVDKAFDKSNRLCTTMGVEDGLFYINSCINKDLTLKPYICKKVEDMSCPTIDHGYQYVMETKKCYKVNKIRRSWRDALNTCLMEGGLLVNIESEMESKIVSKMINEQNTYHAGFRNVSPSRDYYTMKGVNLRYAFWNFFTNNLDKDRLCGSISRNGDSLNLEAHGCDDEQGFVCEIEV